MANKNHPSLKSTKAWTYGFAHLAPSLVKRTLRCSSWLPPNNPQKRSFRLGAITQLNLPDFRAGIEERTIRPLVDHVHRVLNWRHGKWDRSSGSSVLQKHLLLFLPVPQPCSIKERLFVSLFYPERTVCGVRERLSFPLSIRSYTRSSQTTSLIFARVMHHYLTSHHTSHFNRSFYKLRDT